MQFAVHVDLIFWIFARPRAWKKTSRRCLESSSLMYTPLNLWEFLSVDFFGQDFLPRAVSCELTIQSLGRGGVACDWADGFLLFRRYILSTSLRSISTCSSLARSVMTSSRFSPSTSFRPDTRIQFRLLYLGCVVVSSSDVRDPALTQQLGPSVKPSHLAVMLSNSTSYLIYHQVYWIAFSRI